MSEEAYRVEVKRCDKIKDFDARLSCKAELLEKITRVQDTVNLNIMGDFSTSNPQCSKDPRWLPVHIVDNANAVILGISRARYDPKVFWREGSYVQEKVGSLDSKVFQLRF
jgi:hypothetical protein